MAKKEKRYKHKRPFLEVVRENGINVLRVREATEKGYAECYPDGAFDIAYPSSELRRSRVKMGGAVCGAITAGDVLICVFESYEDRID